MKNIRTSAVQVPLLSACVIIMTMCTTSHSPLTGVEFDISIFRSGDNSDNWFVTWAGNSDLYTSQCDGCGWFDGSQLISKPEGKQKWIRWNGSDADDRDKWLINEGDYQMFLYAEDPFYF